MSVLYHESAVCSSHVHIVMKRTCTHMNKSFLILTSQSLFIVCKLLFNAKTPSCLATKIQEFTVLACLYQASLTCTVDIQPRVGEVKYACTVIASHPGRVGGGKCRLVYTVCACVSYICELTVKGFVMSPERNI